MSVYPEICSLVELVLFWNGSTRAYFLSSNNDILVDMYIIIVIRVLKKMYIRTL